MTKIKIKRDAIEERRKAYPDVRDFADAYSEAGITDPEWLATQPRPLQDYVARVKQVKDRFKKDA